MLTIIQKELIELFREGRFRILASITAWLLFTSLWISYRQYKDLQATHTAATAEERHTWENQPEKNPHGAAHFGVYLFKPIQPMSFIEPGVQSYSGSTIYLEAHKRNSEQFNQAQDQTELTRFGHLNPAFVLGTLMPLLIMIMGFAAFSKERESGTLKILISQGLSSWKLLAGKWLGIFIPVLLLVTPFLLVALILLSGIKGFSLNSLLTLFITYFLWYAIIINITLLYSIYFKKSATVFISCLLFWIVTTILIPRLATNVSNSSYPILTQEQIVKKIADMNNSRGGNIHDLSGDLYKKLIDSLLNKYRVDSVSQLPVNMAGIRLDIGEQMDTRNFDIIYNEVKSQFASQQQVYTVASFFSPYIALKDLAMAAAQTNNKAQWHFADAGEQYRREFVNKLNRYIAFESKKQEAFTNFQAATTVWKSIPEFVYHHPSLSEALKGTVPQWLCLFLWLVCTTGLLFLLHIKIKIQ